MPAFDLRGCDSPAQPLPPPSARHQFLEHTWTSLEECDVCGRTLLGLTRQGLRCRVCGLRAHRACEHSGASLPQHRCRPPLPPLAPTPSAFTACSSSALVPVATLSPGDEAGFGGGQSLGLYRSGVTPASSMDSGVEGAGGTSDAFAFEPTSVFEQELEEQFDASSEEAPLLLVWCVASFSFHSFVCSVHSDGTRDEPQLDSKYSTPL